MPPLVLPPLTDAILISPEPLTPEFFSPFGTAICSPLPPTTTKIPSSPSTPPYPAYQPTPVIANQNTALKYAAISPITNNYPHTNSRPQMSMFSCFPRQDTGKKSRYDVKILERHPFTTQTFAPITLSPTSTSLADLYLVIVAPSLPQLSSATRPQTRIRNPPDLTRLRAFIARGGQAVTYGPGTWHAPMVVLGKERVDFVVTQFVSGVPDEDCQEVLVPGGVQVDLGVGAVVDMGPMAKL